MAFEYIKQQYDVSKPLLQAKLSKKKKKNENYAMLDDVTEPQQRYLDMWFIILTSSSIFQNSTT